MSTVEKAFETQLSNIKKKTGKSLDELSDLIKKSGLTKHGEIVNLLKRDLGLGHGDANTLVHFALKSSGEWAAQEKGLTSTDILDEIYVGPKASLRTIHERLMDSINQFGEFEVAPKKGYVSLRRKKQFAMIGPATNNRVEVGINSKVLQANARLEAMPPGGMCNFKVKVTQEGEVNDELIAWIKQAYDSAG